MKKYWIDARKWDKKIVTTAIESGADAVLVEKGYSKKVKELGLIKTISEDGDIKFNKDVIAMEIKSKKDELDAAKIDKTKSIILKTRDWSIIPLENLIAQSVDIIANVESAKEAKVALEILEKGVNGILLSTTNLNEIKKTGRLVKEIQEQISLVKAKITKIDPVGSGDRVCIDTCTNMEEGQGMLVGNSSSGMFLIHSESVENPYVAARPFRVNAGAVHAYVRVSDNKTRYLSEIETGDKVLVVDSKGNAQEAIVGRNKTERRPMMLVEAVLDDKKISLILQNAETIRFVKPSGKPISLVNLKIGDEVIAYTENAGRHFGMKIDETIKEK